MIHVVLYEPEIPQNTGNIIRTCMAMGARLHLIEPLGFFTDDAHLKRAGMDYITSADIVKHENWQAFVQTNPGTYFYVTRYGKNAPDDFDYGEVKEDIYLIFGKESTGIPKHILQKHLDHCIRIPMCPEARTLNLSNCVALCLYEVERQLGYPGLSRTEVQKGEDFLLNYKGKD